MGIPTRTITPLILLVGGCWSLILLRLSIDNSTLTNARFQIFNGNEYDAPLVPCQSMNNIRGGLATVSKFTDYFVDDIPHESFRLEDRYSIDLKKSNRKSPSTKPYVSLVILTYKKFDLFAELLKSILRQNQDYFEIVIVDSGCLKETKRVIQKYLDDTETNNRWNIRYKYLEACDNPGYAIGNNRGVELVAESSQWITLLNDDIIMQGDTFIDSMLDIAETKESAAAAGCKLIVTSGDKIIEAGSMVFKESSAAGFGRGRFDMDSPELSYPRPVDYISGACLMVNKNVFNDYGGFDGKHFPNYYEGK
jgi:hypothetical protein